MTDQAVDSPADFGKLLVLDNETFVREAVAASLRFLGFEVTTAHNGYDGLRLAMGQTFDLIILDVLLPDADGFEVVRRLRTRGAGGQDSRGAAPGASPGIGTRAVAIIAAMRFMPIPSFCS